MKSKIINMVERMKDQEDIKLESLFASDTIADNGFSAKVLKNVRRQMWIRRLSLPIAFVIGAAIAFKPLVSLVTVLSGLAPVIPQTLGADSSLIPTNLMPGMPMIVMGMMAVMVVTMVGKMLED